MAKAVWEGMTGRGYGRIVNIGSINGQAGQYGQVNYAAAKSGIHGFTKALAQEGARAGVTVNAIAPGYIDTDMVAAVPQEVLGKIIARIPVNRLGRADEIGRGVVFLVDGAIVDQEPRQPVEQCHVRPGAGLQVEIGQRGEFGAPRVDDHQPRPGQDPLGDPGTDDRVRFGGVRPREQHRHCRGLEHTAQRELGALDDPRNISARAQHVVAPAVETQQGRLKRQGRL